MGALDAWRREVRALIPRGFLRRDAGEDAVLVSDYPRWEEAGAVTERLRAAGYAVAVREGLAHIEAVAKLASRILREGGILVLEHGFRQAAGVAEVLEDLGFDKIIAKKDLAGLDRVTRGVYKCPRCC